MNTITHTVDQAVFAMVENTELFFAANVQNLVCYNFKNFDGHVSIRIVDGRYVDYIRAKVIDTTKTDGSYFWCKADLPRRDRPSVMDRDWMRDMFKAINEIARQNFNEWEDMGAGFNPIKESAPPLKFR